MAKSVSLAGDRPDKPTQEELMARATGQKKPAPGLPTPPPAAGVRGKPPIPKGVPVFTPDPNSLTEVERQALNDIKWKPGEQVTGNIADILAAVKGDADAEKAAELDRLAASAPTQAKYAPVDASSLSPDKQAEVHRRMQETMAAVANEQKFKEEQRAGIGMPESVRDALKVADAPHGIEVEDDRPQRRQRAAEPAEPTDTGVTTAHPGNCPHCGWDQTVTDDIEVADGDKTVFLQSVLGEKAFTKEYDLFGGKVNVTFRTLTGKEIDKVYAQVFHEKRLGEIMTDMDFYERVNRYRLFLQIQSLRSNSFHHDFPEGFTRETNDTAATFYELPDDRPEGETGLREVERYVVKTALKTELISNMVVNQCRLFNRLAAKLQAMADNPDFWQATGG